MKKNKNLHEDYFFSILGTTIGTIIISASLYFFLIPAKISPGGVNGISLIIKILTGFPIYIMNLCINVPLFIFGAKLLGKKCAILTLLSTILLSVCLKAMAVFFPAGIPEFTEDMMLAAMAGGVILGLGLGTVLRSGGTTGGTDLAASMINQSHPGFSIPKAMASIDLTITIMTGVTTGKPQLSLYSLVTIFLAIRISNTILTGFEYFKGMMIISSKPKEVGEALMEELNRGLTILKSSGMYSKQDRPVLLCVMHRRQLAQAKEIINSIDKNSFTMIMDIKEVFGLGFNIMEKER